MKKKTLFGTILSLLLFLCFSCGGTAGGGNSNDNGNGGGGGGNPNPPDDEQTVTLTYHSDHGVTPNTIQVVSGTKLTNKELPELSEDGWIFGGWYADDRWLIKVGYLIEGDLDLYAHWSEEKQEPEINYYDVTFDANGRGKFSDGSTTFIRAYKEGECIQGLGVEELTADKGYIFDGWYTEAECINKFDFSTPVTKNLHLYAKWKTGSFISVTVDSASDIAIDEARDGDIITLTATEGLYNYMWGIDGVYESTDSNVFTINTKKMVRGTHVVTVVAGDKSATIYITID